MRPRAARDHLANERTWLAYLRTSLALASTGVGAPPDPIYLSHLAAHGNILFAIACAALLHNPR